MSSQVKVKSSGLIVLILLSCSEYSATSSNEPFCGHSVKQSEDGIKVRRERSIEEQSIRTDAQRQQQYDDPQVPENQQEDQIVIDETSFGQMKQENGARNADSRIECSKTTSRFNPNPEFQSGAQQTMSDADCSLKTIETAVFIDQVLDNKFNSLSNGLVELNKLVLTIMNQVQHIFSYSSMKIPIKIKLVLVEHLKDITRSGLSAPNAERGDIDLYLSNFCNWQQARLQAFNGLWWDHAILLSGLDLYKATPSKNHTGVLGLAWVGGMCKGNYSCTINEATNLESAFVIAHEIGHSLGIMHDGQRNGCDSNGFIMSERTGAGKVHWSRCSNNYLNDSIQRRQLTCLNTEQSVGTDPLYDLSKLRSPGQVYTINDQCKIAFGNNYTSFVTRQQPFNAVCRELWCVAGTWAKAAHPALEGSACGDQERVCREGKCSLR